MITKKRDLITYFESGCKSNNEFKIGIEHEKFLFNLKTNKRIDYETVIKMFKALYEFGWKPILEDKNIIGLKKKGKSITLEPGNQIELSGDKLNNIHEACSESMDYLFELNQVIQKLNLKIVSAGFDPISKLLEVPNNPKQRYKVMTKDMPLGGSLSLDMMYRTCGTQINLDYSSEKDFITILKPENRFYPITGNFTSEVSIHTNMLRDLYIVLGQGNQNDGWVVRVYYNPLVIWIWIGALTIFLGGVVSINYNLKKIPK